MSLASFRQALAWLLLGALGWCLYRILESFLSPLAWAAVLSTFFAPWHRRLRSRIPNRDLAAVLATVLVTGVLIVPALLVLQAVVAEGIALASGIPGSDLLLRLRHSLDSLPEPLARFFSGQQLERIVAEVASWARSNLARESARLAGNLARFFFELGVTLFALFYFFRDGHYLTHWISDLGLMGEERRRRLLRDVANDVRVTVSSTLVVAASQGTLGGLMFWTLGLSNPLLWGVVMGMVSLLPVLGPWLIYAPTGIYLLVNGHYLKGIMLLALGFGVVSGADNLLRPFLIAGRSRLNALWVFLSVVGGLQAFGLLGVVLGPVLVSAAAGFLRAVREDAKAGVAQPENPSGATHQEAERPSQSDAPDPPPADDPAPPEPE